MPAPPIKPERVQNVLAEYARQMEKNPKLTVKEVAAKLGMPRTTLSHYIHWYGTREELQVGELSVEQPPKTEEPIEDLLARKRARLEASVAENEWSKLIPVQVNSDKPIAVTLVGDPHVDDDHCDIVSLEHDLTVVGKTKGMYAGHIGDLTNNWVGRLAALYAHQSTTFSEGLRLTDRKSVV